MEPPGGGGVPSRAGLGPGLFKSSNGSLPRLGGSGKCSPPAALASAGRQARGPDVGSGLSPAFPSFPPSSPGPREPGLPAPWAVWTWSRGLDSEAEARGLPGLQMEWVMSLKASSWGCWDQPSPSPLWQHFIKLAGWPFFFLISLEFGFSASQPNEMAACEI